MKFEQDYLMRTIKTAVEALVRVIFHKTEPSYELSADQEQTAADDLYGRLVKMADEGRINEAENLLYKELDPNDRNYLEMGIGFYYHINAYEEDYLTDNNYTREEISDGIRQLLGEFDMGSLSEFLEI